MNVEESDEFQPAFEKEGYGERNLYNDDVVHHPGHILKSYGNINVVVGLYVDEENKPSTICVEKSCFGRKDKPRGNMLEKQMVIHEDSWNENGVPAKVNLHIPPRPVG